MKIDKLFAGLSLSALGLTAQRKRMNAIASNMANAETTKTDAGGPYQRRVVTVHSSGPTSFAHVLHTSGTALAATDPNHISSAEESTDAPEQIGGGVDTKESLDNTPFRTVYDPSHPDADESGYVKMPNVNIVSEMVDMLTASRAYEANVTAANAAKSIAKDALEI